MYTCVCGWAVYHIGGLYRKGGHEEMEVYYKAWIDALTHSYEHILKFFTLKRAWNLFERQVLYEIGSWNWIKNLSMSV